MHLGPAGLTHPPARRAGRHSGGESTGESQHGRAHYAGDQRSSQDADFRLAQQLRVTGESQAGNEERDREAMPATAETPSSLESVANPCIGAIPTFTAAQVDAKIPTRVEGLHEPGERSLQLCQPLFDRLEGLPIEHLVAARAQERLRVHCKPLERVARGQRGPCGHD